MVALLDLLADGSHPAARVTAVGDGETRTTFRDIWRLSDRACAWLAQRTEPGETIAAVMASTPECLAVVVGAWRAGLRVASLPHPARAMSPEGYRQQLDTLCALVEARRLFADDPAVAATRTPTLPFAAVGADTPPAERVGARFVQFSSGSTGRPKGIELGLDALAANITGMLAAMGPPDRLSLCSWLPLSHDMGLIGACLGTWAGSGPRWAGQSHLVLIDTRRFQANPTSWLRWTSGERCQITVVPNFAVEIMGRRLERAGTGLDLSGLEVCIVGAEPVRAAALERFGEAAAAFGFDAGAFCPSYGMAEASVGVTMTRCDERWRQLRLDRDRLDVGEVAIVDAAADGDGPAFVAVGRPIPGMELRIAGDRAVGPIELRGTSLFDRYVGDDAPPARTADGWFQSKDLGFLHGGDLFVTGRTDDVMFVAGRNVYVAELEHAVGQLDGLRPDHCAVVADDDGRYRIVAERRRGTRFRERLADTCRQVRVVAVRLWGAAPREVVLVAPGSFPKTPSGKLQRGRLRDALHGGDLAVDARHTFGSAED